jgi:hypothetical protein
MAATVSKLHPAVSGAIVTVKNGFPDPKDVYVLRNGTVQFVNHDPVSYRLRIYTHESDIHPDVDILLSGRGGVTLIIDPDLGPLGGKCYYELLPIEVTYLTWLDEAYSDITVSGTESSATNPPRREGGGKIGLDPGGNPTAPPYQAFNKKGPGGGTITS